MWDESEDEWYVLHERPSQCVRATLAYTMSAWDMKIYAGLWETCDRCGAKMRVKKESRNLGTWKSRN